jgi:hypothetical protein
LNYKCLGNLMIKSRMLKSPLFFFFLTNAEPLEQMDF